MIYFDYNATAPLLPEAREAWLRVSEQFIGNASSPHRLGGRAEAVLNDCRERLALYLGCSSADIIWTSGATESNNTVLRHFSTTARKRKEIWVSSVEHPCVLAAADRYFPKQALRIPVDHNGVVSREWIEKNLRDRRPALVAVMAANNETGVLQPWPEIAALCKSKSVPFFCDAAQWIGKLPVANVGQCEFVSGCAHKFGGPKGVGFLKCSGNLSPLLVGGSQEGSRRAGTENIAGVASMMAAVDACEKHFTASDHLVREKWRRHFESELVDRLTGVEIIGAAVPRLWNTVALLMPAMAGRFRWVVKLDKAGFAVSTGSACASGKEEPSHVLAAIGYNAGQAARALRCSSGWQTTRDEWDQLLNAMEKIQKQGVQENLVRSAGSNAKNRRRIAPPHSKTRAQR